MASCCPHLKVLMNIQCPEDPPTLGHMNKAPSSDIVREMTFDLLPIEPNGALVRNKLRYGAEHRGLSGTVGAEQCDELTFTNVEIDASNGLDRAILNLQPSNLKHGPRFRGTRPRRPDRSRSPQGCLRRSLVPAAIPKFDHIYPQ